MVELASTLQRDLRMDLKFSWRGERINAFWGMVVLGSVLVKLMGGAVDWKRWDDEDDCFEWQARRAIHFETADWYFFGTLREVWLVEAETVDATELDPARRVLGTWDGGRVGVGMLNWKSGIQGIAVEREVGQIVLGSNVDGGNVSLVRIAGSANTAASISGFCWAMRASAMRCLEMATQAW